MTREGLHFVNDPMFQRLERQMDDLVERLMRRPGQAAYQRGWAPRLDVCETEGEFVMVVELAGVEPSDVTIEIEGEQVDISGRRSPAACPQGGEILQLEIPFGEFQRRVILPLPVDPSGATAGFSDGVLTVRLPKIRHNPARVQIEVSRGGRSRTAESRE